MGGIDHTNATEARARGRLPGTVHPILPYFSRVRRNPLGLELLRKAKGSGLLAEVRSSFQCRLRNQAITGALQQSV
jgi:hypothetical protein